MFGETLVFWFGLVNIIYVASAAIKFGNRGPWQLNHLYSPACRCTYQSQRFDYLYRFLGFFCSFLPSWRLNRAKLQMFPFHLAQDSETSYTINSLFHFWLRSNTGFNHLLSIPVSFSGLQYFDCHEKFLWSSVRKSVSVLSFKVPVFCFPLWLISISLLLFNFLEQGMWSNCMYIIVNYLVEYRFDERPSHHWSCGFGSPATPVTPKQWNCCSLAHEQSTPEESWVSGVSIYWLHKSIYNIFCCLPHSPYKCAVYLGGEKCVNPNCPAIAWTAALFSSMLPEAESCPSAASLPGCWREDL